MSEYHEQRWVPPKKAQELLSIGKTTLFKLIKTNVLVSKKVGPKARRISVDSINEVKEKEAAE